MKKVHRLQLEVYYRIVWMPDLATERAHMGIWGHDRLRHSVGIETKGGRFTPLISRGTRLPVSLTEIFTTADPDQTSIKIHPFHGEHKLTAFNTSLGLFEVTEIPPARPGEPQIEVTFHVDAQGELSITARDVSADEELPVLRR